MVKAVLGFVGVSDADLVSRCNAVHDGMTNNPAYPTPPIDMPGFKTAIDAYAAAVAGALDGGKAAIATRNKRRGDVILLLHQLGHYVEVACKGDMNTFVSSGFVAGFIDTSLRAAAGWATGDRLGQSRHQWSACGDDPSCPEGPALRVPIRSGPRCAERPSVGQPSVADDQTANGAQQPHPGRDVHLPGPCLRHTGLLRLE